MSTQEVETIQISGTHTPQGFVTTQKMAMKGMKKIPIRAVSGRLSPMWGSPTTKGPIILMGEYTVLSGYALKGVIRHLDPDTVITLKFSDDLGELHITFDRGIIKLRASLPHPFKFTRIFKMTLKEDQYV